MPEGRAYADVVGRFRRGAGEARVGHGRYADAARIDPANADSYMAMEDRATERRRAADAETFNHSYADAISRNDYSGAETIAGKHGSVQAITAARGARQEADEQQRLEVFRGMQRTLGELEGFDANQGQGYAEWRQRAQQALAQNPDMDPTLAEIARGLPPEWSPRVSGALRARFQRMLDENLTPQQLATLQNQRETRENQGWSIDAYGRPYRNNGGFIERRNEAGEIVRDDAPVPVPRDRVPGPQTYGPSGLSDQQIDNESTYAARWDRVQQNFSEVRNEFQRIETMAARRDAAGDLALVVSFTKMLDPGSVAREGEVALTQSAASALGQAQNWLPRLQQGGTLLPPTVRTQLLEAARQMYGVYEGSYNRLAEDYRATAEDYGFDPRRVMRGYQAPPPPEPPPRTPYYIARPESGNSGVRPPQEGDVENGYRFLGGDPADPNNWRPER